MGCGMLRGKEREVILKDRHCPTADFELLGGSGESSKVLEGVIYNLCFTKTVLQRGIEGEQMRAWSPTAAAQQRHHVGMDSDRGVKGKGW